MKHNPSQYQLDQAIRRGDIIKIMNPTLTSKIYTKFTYAFFGIEPDYVSYQGNKYDSKLVLIYPKEEVASLIQKDLDCTIHRKDSLATMERKTVTVLGDINRISLMVGNTVYSFPYDEINLLLTNIQSRYQQALENPQSANFQELKRLYMTEHRCNGYEYQFINGFKLEIVVTKNIQSNKYKLFEYSLGIESEEFDNEEDATKDLFENLGVKIDTLFDNKLCKIEKLIKRKRAFEGNDIKF